MDNELLYEQIKHTLDLIQNDIRSLRNETNYNNELSKQRIDLLEKQSLDHETRIRDATNGVVQFRLWSTLTNSGSTVMSLTALIKSFLS